MRLATRRRGDRGASAVELALVLPVLLLVLGGIIDLGRMFMAAQSVSQAATAGARMAALRYSAADVETRSDAAASGLPAASVTATIVTACPGLGTTITTQAATVRVDHQFTFLVLDGVINLFGGGWSATKTLSSTGSMRCTG